MPILTRTIQVAGTTLANAAPVPDASIATVASIKGDWRGRRNSYFLQEAHSLSRWTLAIGATIHISVIALFADAGFPAWRLCALGSLFVVFMAAQRVVVAKAYRDQCVEGAFILMNVLAQVFVIGWASLSGGLHSPFLPSLILPSIVSLLFFGPIPASRWIALCNGLLILAMMMLPASITGPGLPDLHYSLGVVLALGWGILMLHRMAGKLAIAASRAGDSYACMREERVSEAEAQLRRLQSVGAKVAHELKNPLASIKGLCQLVSRTPESERTQERLAVVASEIDRMETILNEYLTFSRPLEDLHPEACDLATLARDVLEVLAGRADQAGVSLSFEGSAPSVHGDPRRLKEALINLVANAIEATPSGGAVAVRLRAGATTTLEVRDTGRGIAPDDLERLGTSFFTTRPNGTGLGVVLAQGVITQHGGTLAYTSAVGQGTTATITLPGKQATSPEPSLRAAMVEARA